MAKDKRSVGKVLNRPKEIRTYLGNPSLVLSDCFIGIEIELEGLPSTSILAEESYWDLKADNSLRNYSGASGEFVLKFPLCGEDLIRALRQFDEVIKSLPSPPITSERTSVHVHLDARDLSPEQLYSLVILYCVFERVLFKYCGKDRENNNFCLPFYLAEGAVFEQLSDVQNSEGLLSFTDRVADSYRYSALNLCSLRKFGSIEFRQCAGTYDISRIMEWVGIIMCLKKYVLEHEIAFDTFPAHVSDVRYIGIVEEVFGKYSARLLYSGIESDILSGVRQAQKIIFSSNKMKVLDTILKTLSPLPNTVSGESLVDKYTYKKWGRKSKGQPPKVVESPEVYAPTRHRVFEEFDVNPQGVVVSSSSTEVRPISTREMIETARRALQENASIRNIPPIFFENDTGEPE